MGASGHIFDMIKKQKANRDLQKVRRDHYAEKIAAGKSVGAELQYDPSFSKEYSAKEREAIDTKIRKEARREQSRALFIAVIVVAVIVVLFALS